GGGGGRAWSSPPPPGVVSPPPAPGSWHFRPTPSCSSLHRAGTHATTWCAERSARRVHASVSCVPPSADWRPAWPRRPSPDAISPPSPTPASPPPFPLPSLPPPP